MCGVLRARLPHSTLALLVTLVAYVHAQEFTRKVFLEQPVGQTEQVLSPIYSLFGMPAETAPKLYRIQSPTVGGNVRFVSATTQKSSSAKAGRHPTPALIENAEPEPQSDTTNVEEISAQNPGWIVHKGTEWNRIKFKVAQKFGKSFEK